MHSARMAVSCRSGCAGNSIHFEPVSRFLGRPIESNKATVQTAEYSPDDDQSPGLSCARDRTSGGPLRRQIYTGSGEVCSVMK